MTAAPSRPYARSKKWPVSVTTVLSAAIAKPGLAWGASKEAALFAVFHQDEWMAMEPAAAIDRIRKHHQGIWNGRAAVGTALHAVNEAWSQGETVDVTAECEPFVDGLEAFWREWQPTWHRVEYVVLHEDAENPYIGTADGCATLADGRRWLLDIKTTANEDSDGYPEEWRLQLAAYRFAEQIVHLDEKGNETAEREPNEPVDACGVIHIKADGSYRLLELQVGETEMLRFLHCRGVWQWLNRDCKTDAPIVSAPPKALEAVG